MAGPKKTSARAAAKTRAASGRYLELIQEVQAPEPYEIADGLIIDPPSKTMADNLNDAQYRMAVANAMTQAMLAAPDAYTPDYFQQVRQMSEKAVEDYNDAFFNGKYRQVQEFFTGESNEYWNAFVTDYKAQMWPKEPDAEGICATCGHDPKADTAPLGPASLS
ncbi:hypothetical protein BKG86_01805 [Mycobacteroides chelonae]|uniref:hypothetical protein n=1 Tax=Mycobacteroides chelonae TaxID=1774 RepID=UPI0008A94B27|nr:hypothetical protein [Mycobacteroides chelonae]OHU68814.1 hypothetical protein BKG86_01805 [Mycobacteroides chelonae]